MDNQNKLLHFNSSTSEPTGSARIHIARTVTRLAIWGTILLGLAAIIFLFFINDNEKQIQLLQYVFTALLPLWGTWMGTVMAYYFSKENFLAANQSVQKLVDQITPAQKLLSIKSKEVMIPFTDIKPYPVTPPAGGALPGAAAPPPDGPVPPGNNSSNSILSIKIVEALAFMNNNKIMRLPLFIDKKLKFVIHQSAFEKYITEQTLKGHGATVNSATINSMIEQGSDQIKGYLSKGAEFVKEDSNLRDAQLLIEKNSFCQDVFVTINGKADEEVLGWITNTIITEIAKV